MATGKFERVIADRGFGFIRVDGGGRAHFTVRDCPDAKEGKRVEFELQDPEPSQGPHAINLKLLEDGDKPAARAPAKKVKKDELAHSFRFGEMTENDGLMRVPVWITFTRSNEPVPGQSVTLQKIEVTLNTDSREPEMIPREVLTPSRKAVTDAAGEAYFVLYMLSGTTFCDLVAKASSKEYPGSWSMEAKQEEAAAPEAPVAEAKPAGPLKIERRASRFGTYRFRITGAEPNTEVGIQSYLETEFREDGLGDAWASDKLNIGEDGTLTFELRVKTEGARGPIRIIVGEVESDRFYVVHPLPPQASAAAKG